jgi:hypothetical protein
MKYEISIPPAGGCDEVVQRTLRSGSVFRSERWHRAIAEACGYERAVLVVRAGENVVAALPLCVGRDLFRRRTAVALPFTAFIDTPNATPAMRTAMLEQLPAACAAAGLHRLQLRLDEPLAASGTGANLERLTYVLPLAGRSRDELLACASPDHRRRLALARKTGLLHVRPATVTQFYETYRDRMKTLGSPAPSAVMFVRIASTFGRAVTILGAFDGKRGTCAGAMFLLRDAATTYFLWGAASREYQRQHVNHLLYRAAIELAHASGSESFDFGRSDVRSGVGAFKKQFGAKPRQLFYYSFDRDRARPALLPRRGIQVGSAIWRHLPHWATNAAGAFVCGAVFP